MHYFFIFSELPFASVYPLHTPFYVKPFYFLITSELLSLETFLLYDGG